MRYCEVGLDNWMRLRIISVVTVPILKILTARITGIVVDDILCPADWMRGQLIHLPYHLTRAFVSDMYEGRVESGSVWV